MPFTTTYEVCLLEDTWENRHPPRCLWERDIMLTELESLSSLGRAPTASFSYGPVNPLEQNVNEASRPSSLDDTNHMPTQGKASLLIEGDLPER